MIQASETIKLNLINPNIVTKNILNLQYVLSTNFLQLSIYYTGS